MEKYIKKNSPTNFIVFEQSEKNYSKKKSRTSSKHYSNHKAKNVFEVTTAGGAKYIQTVDICRDHMLRMGQVRTSQHITSTTTDFIPHQADHIITASSLQGNYPYLKNHSITKKPSIIDSLGYGEECNRCIMLKGNSFSKGCDAYIRVNKKLEPLEFTLEASAEKHNNSLFAKYFQDRIKDRLSPYILQDRKLNQLIDRIISDAVRLYKNGKTEKPDKIVKSLLENFGRGRMIDEDPNTIYKNLSRSCTKKNYKDPIYNDIHEAIFTKRIGFFIPDSVKNMRNHVDEINKSCPENYNLQHT